MPTPPGYADCSYELRHSSMSRSAFITFGVDVTGTDPVTIAGQVKDAFANAGSLLTIMDNSVSLIATRVSLGTDGSEDIVGVNRTAVPCTRSQQSLPAQCAVLVRKVTARGGRRGRGRMYIPWSASAAGFGENGTVATGEVPLVQAAVDVWKNALSATAGPLVVLHRPSAPGTMHPTTAGLPNLVTSLVVDPLLGTQRRRLGR